MNTHPASIRSFLTSSRDCAIQMMENAEYIQRHLPQLRMPDALRAEIQALCTSLGESTQALHRRELAIREILASDPESSDIADQIRQMHLMISNRVMNLHFCIGRVQRAVEMHEADGILSLLLQESAGNILDLVPANPESEMDAETSAEQDDEFSDEDATDDDSESDAASCDSDSYAFHLEDRYWISLLTSVLDRLAKRTDLEEETAEQLKVFRYAMARLPDLTPGIRMNLMLRLDMGQESEWREIRIEDDTFLIGQGVWIHGDAHTETVFEVTPDKRDGDSFASTLFADSFAECATDVCRELIIQDFGTEFREDSL